MAFSSRPPTGSFELLMRREAGGDREYEPLFKLESWRVIVEEHADGRATTEATDQDLGWGRAVCAHRRGERARSCSRQGPA